jgi:hypothetical protein
MARAGRELELLVAHLERNLGSSDITVTSPDWLEDKVTGERREIDISLKGKVGSHNVLIILECRDKKRNEDVTWIEQLVTKREAVGANKAIAVSSIGFTSGAIAKANHENIELRTLEELTSDSIKDWFSVSTIKNRSFSLEIAAKADLRYFKKDKRKAESYLKKIGENHLTEKNILDHNRDGPISISDLVNEKHIPEISQYTKPGEYIFVREGVLQPQNSDKGFILLIPGSKTSSNIVLDRILYTAKFVVTVVETPVASVKSYKSKNGKLADVIRFESAAPLNPDQSIEIIGIREGAGRKIGVRIVDNKK